MNKAQSASSAAVLTAKSSNPKPTKSMLLRFDVDQAECFRRGIDCPKSTASIEVKPSELSQEERTLIADRMVGIDVCENYVLNSYDLDSNGVRKIKKLERCIRDGKRIKASTPDYAGLIDAVRKNEMQVLEIMKKVHGQ